MGSLKEFWDNYKGAIIGIIIAIVLLATRLYDVIIGILLILAGAIIGNYVQQNKDDVKAKLKKFIDKIINLDFPDKKNILKYFYGIESKQNY